MRKKINIGEILKEFWKKFSCKRCGKNIKNGRSKFCIDCFYEIKSEKYQEKKSKRWLKEVRKK